MTPHLLAELSGLFSLEALDAYDRDDLDEGDRLHGISEELHERCMNASRLVEEQA